MISYKGTRENFLLHVPDCNCNFGLILKMMDKNRTKEETENDIFLKFSMRPFQVVEVNGSNNLGRPH